MSLGLNNLRPPKGSKRNKKRIGRGTGSGTGKTAGKGHKGQNARAGGVRSRGFEGGQMPLSRRIPKFGFTNFTRVEYEVVNVKDLKFAAVDGKVDHALLVARNLVGSRSKVKVLADGEINEPILVIADKFSKKAAEKIIKAGGKVETR